MDLAFGSNVREHFYSIGRLAGLEADSFTRAVRNILVSTDGAASGQPQRRPFAAVQAEHLDGDIELRELPADVQAPTGGQPVILTSATPLTQDGRRIGHLTAVEIDPATGRIAAVVGRNQWWSPRLHLEAEHLDFSTSGEIRITDPH